MGVRQVSRSKKDLFSCSNHDYPIFGINNKVLIEKFVLGLTWVGKAIWVGEHVLKRSKGPKTCADLCVVPELEFCSLLVCRGLRGKTLH